MASLYMIVVIIYRIELIEKWFFFFFFVYENHFGYFNILNKEFTLQRGIKEALTVTTIII